MQVFWKCIQQKEKTKTACHLLFLDFFLLKHRNEHSIFCDVPKFNIVGDKTRSKNKWKKCELLPFWFYPIIRSRFHAYMYILVQMIPPKGVSTHPTIPWLFHLLSSMLPVSAFPGPSLPPSALHSRSPGCQCDLWDEWKTPSTSSLVDSSPLGGQTTVEIGPSHNKYFEFNAQT